MVEMQNGLATLDLEETVVSYKVKYVLTILLSNFISKHLHKKNKDIITKRYVLE